MGKLTPIKPIPKLSQRQWQCLTFIAWYLQKNRLYPTQKEIANALNLKSNSAWNYTEALKKKNFLTVDTELGVRNLRLTDQSYEVLDSEDLKNWDGLAINR